MEVAGIIRGLKNKCSKLLDIHPSILKENLELFSQHIELLYNFSLVEAEFPNDLKVARVNPIHKSGQHDLIDNYRPISTLPVFSKVFEKLTYKRMENFIHKHKILTPCQFCFSTTYAIIRLLSNAVQAYHDKIYSVCFFLDLRKAFDTIDHKNMLRKLEHYGFRGQSHKYLGSYFHNRKQYVQLGNHKSSFLPFTHGVPQGSILGPLCFSIYINDMPLAVEASTVLFADDAAFVLTSDTIEGLYHKIQKLLSDLSSYLNMNRLIPNSGKSKLMMFTSRPLVNNEKFFFGGEEIEWVNEFKYLGLTLSNTLSFAKHINKIASNISRITGTFIIFAT